MRPTGRNVREIESFGRFFATGQSGSPIRAPWAVLRPFPLEGHSMRRKYWHSVLLVLSGLFIAITAVGQPNVVITETARKHFKAGVAYIDDPAGPKYEEAYKEFHLAYAESPSYRILTNIGLCALNLERDGEAIEAYEQFLAHATKDDIPKDKRAIMERDITTLKASLVRLNVTVNPVTVILNDERISSKGTSVINRYEVKNGKIVLGIHPGHHRLTATAEGFEPQTWEFDAEPTSTQTRDFKLSRPSVKGLPANTATAIAVATPSETNRKPNLNWVYVGAATTGLFAASATLTGIIAKEKMSDFDRVNKAGDDPTEARALRDSGKTFALLTDIGIGAAILSAGATTYFYFSATSRKAESKPAIARWQLQPSVSPNQAGLAVSGNF